jgi:hypothetical protein
MPCGPDGRRAGGANTSPDSSVGSRARYRRYVDSDFAYMKNGSQGGTGCGGRLIVELAEQLA